MLTAKVANVSALATFIRLAANTLHTCAHDGFQWVSTMMTIDRAACTSVQCIQIPAQTRNKM